MVRTSDLRLSGRGFDSRPFRCQVTTLDKLFTLSCLCSIVDNIQLWSNITDVQIEQRRRHLTHSISAMHLTLPSAAVQCIVNCDEQVSRCVSLYVCLSVRLHISKTTRPNFTKTAQKYGLYLSHLLKSPLERICTKFGEIEGVVNGNIRVNFLGDRLIRGVDYVRVEFCHFTLTNPVAVSTMLTLPFST